MRPGVLQKKDAPPVLAGREGGISPGGSLADIGSRRRSDATTRLRPRGLGPSLAPRSRTLTSARELLGLWGWCWSADITPYLFSPLWTRSQTSAEERRLPAILGGREQGRATGLKNLNSTEPWPLFSNRPQARRLGSLTPDELAPRVVKRD